VASQYQTTSPDLRSIASVSQKAALLFGAFSDAAVAWASRPWNGYALAIASVAVALAARLAFGTLGEFFYLTLIPAVALPAILASRRAAVVAIILSVLANVWLPPHDAVSDTVIAAMLFIAVGLGIGECGRARHRARARADKLASSLTTREAIIHAMLALTPVVTLDENSTILTMSQPACTLFKVQEAEVTGQPFRRLVDAFDPAVIQASGKGGPGPDQYWLGRRSDGDVFALGIQLAVIAAPPKAPDVVLTLTDLSLWHSAETRNKELGDQLNKVWRLNSLGEIAATLSHELNQPLTAAVSYLHASQADLARAGIFGASASRVIDLAKGQILRAGDIIRRARALLSVGSLPLQAERVSSMVDDLGPILQLLSRAVDAQVQNEIHDTDDIVLADRIQFQQAMLNLVRNAVEAVSDQPRREIVIRGRAISPNAYRISVEDSGPGVARECIDRMFQPLMTTKADGMGLGLSVTRTIIEKHGGALAYQTSDLGGAAFIFDLQRCLDPGDMK
jgi:two-component system sensor kinase FixL